MTDGTAETKYRQSTCIVLVHPEIDLAPKERRYRYPWFFTLFGRGVYFKKMCPAADKEQGKAKQKK